jgi:hypothetical protein
MKHMTKKILLALFLVVVGMMVPVAAKAGGCESGKACCENCGMPCCK